jgi:cytosine/adenosine deaminase-related metal-dependent hydrolase
MTSLQRFAARLLWLGPDRVYAPGEVRVRAGRVVFVGPLRRGSRVPPRAILPGLVDAHVHLQIPPLDRPCRRFVDWLRAVMRARHRCGWDDHVAQADAAVAGLLNEGVTAVGEVDSTGASPVVLRRHRVAGSCYREVTGFDLDAAAAADLLDRSSGPGSRFCRAGWSPHAPYSVSRHLFRAVHTRGRPLAIHVAESAEEEQFLAHGSGPFRDLLEELGRLPAGFRPAGVGAVTMLSRLGLLGPGTTLIHAQHISRREAQLVAKRGSPVVVCPGTIRYFRRPAPPVAEWMAMGIPVALGTDSLASNTRLSLRHELQLARSLWPALSPATLLGMVTEAGGRAVGRAGVGQLRRGGPASLVVAEMTAPATARGIAAFLDEFTAGGARVTEVWLRGRRVS